MYERSAIVLEKYIEKILKLDKTNNLKKNVDNYSELINEIENFQITTERDLKVIQEFDDTVRRIENIQKEQEKLYKSNQKLEDDRAQLFGELGEDFQVLENKLRKIEDILEKNNKRMRELREEFIKNLQDFSEKQKSRNKCDKEKRVSEARNIKYIQEMENTFKAIDIKDVTNLKDFISSEKEQVRKEALDIMTKNGKNERIQFNKDVLKKAVNNRIDIAEKEAECYVLIFDKMKRILSETDTETIKLEKYKKILRDTTVKLAFLRAQKEYIVGFLDYERMTAISGTKAHNKMMLEACNNFELDMIQIKKLYELLLKETVNKATQRAYKELYNKNYLKNIEDKEKNFEEEANNVNLKSGTIINSNYWRIEGIKNIYMVFQEEISEKFERDLSEYRIEEIEETDDIEDNKIDNYKEKEEYYEEDDDEDNEEYEEDEEYEDEDDNQYDDDQYDEDENIEDDEYDDEDDFDEYDEDEDIEDIEDEDEEEDEEYEEDEDIEEYEDEDEIEEINSDDIDSIIKNSRKKTTPKTTKKNKTSKAKKEDTKTTSKKENKTKQQGKHSKQSSKSKTQKNKKENNKDKKLFKFFKK